MFIGFTIIMSYFPTQYIAGDFRTLVKHNIHILEYDANYFDHLNFHEGYRSEFPQRIVHGTNGSFKILMDIT